MGKSTTKEIEYDSHGFEGYLGNVGQNKKITSKVEGKMLFLACILFPTIIVLADGDMRENAYFWIFGLDSYENTVDDFKDASIEVKVHWEMNACNGGECLLSVDWDCGFAYGDETAVSSCIGDELMSADMGTSLDTKRKRCGRRHMEFVAELYAKKTMCNAKWGKLN